MAEQNYVEYCLFPTEEVSLEDMSTDLLTFAKHFQQNYIWQKDAFHLKPSHTRQQKSKKKKDPMKNAPPHLYYKLHFGDCLDDEWFVVFLLLQISSSKPIQDKYNPIITIQDNDGEFLLIEAAYSLPKWISKPKHAINRVFLYNGSLHLLPRCISIQDPSSFDFTNTGELYNNADSFPEISDAIKFLLNNHKSTLASKTIQTSAFGRIEKFNTALRQFEAGEIDTLQEQHFACVFVPRCIAKLLGQPNFLAQAIQSLYELDFDPQALRIDPKYKKVKNICEFHRSQFPQTNEWVRIRFSRWLYAQLNFFHLPFGKMSVEEEVKMKQQFSGAEMKGILLGRKLEFAFSLLYHKCKMEEDLDYIVYEIERVFAELEGMKNEINAIVDRGELPQDDDEGWLEVSPEEVNDLLSKKQSEADQMKPLDDLMKNMNEFMEGSSGLDGVDFGEDSYSSEDDEFYSGESDEEIRELMKQMDSELKTSDAYGYDFVKTTNDDGETIIDEDVNFMKHLLSSLEEQPLSNPLANLVNSFTL